MSEEWFANDDFWKMTYPYMFNEKRFASAAVQVQNLLALTEFKGRDVLDLACGPGRHAILLAKEGFQVTGVDLSPFLLEKARLYAAREAADVEWLQADMRDFRRDEAFDLVINMFTAFGYFEDPDEDVNVLKNIYHSLRPGGRLLLEMAGKEQIAMYFKDVDSFQFDDGTLFIQRREIRHNWTRIYNHWMVIQGNTVQSMTFEHTLYSARELADRLALAGFVNIRIFGNLEGDPYGIAPSGRLVVLADKPG